MSVFPEIAPYDFRPGREVQESLFDFAERSNDFSRAIMIECCFGMDIHNVRTSCCQSERSEKSASHA